jgi:LPS export ABC transporter protein LptC
MRFRILGCAAALWLAACNNSKTSPPSADNALADSADQVMFTARFNLTDHGLMRAQLQADRAYFFEESTRAELENVNTTFFSAGGEKEAVLTARRGSYNSRGGGMVARGNVVVISETGRRLTTQELRYDPSMNEVASDSAFVLTEPGRRLEGIGFRADPNMNNVRVLKAARGSAGETSTDQVSGKQ